MNMEKAMCCVAAFECGAEGNWRTSALVLAVIAASASVAVWLDFGRIALGSVSG